MTRLSEQTIYNHLTNPDSLDTLAKAGFGRPEIREVIPTQLGRTIVAWAIEYFFAGNRVVAPSRQAILDTFGAEMERYDIVIDDETETDTIEWAIKDLRSFALYRDGEKWVKTFTEAIYSATADTRVQVLQEHVQTLNSLAYRVVDRGHEMTGLQGVDDALWRYAQRADDPGTIRGLSFGLDELDAHTLGVQPGEIATIAGAPSSGKAAWVQTPVPTPTGWSTMGDLQVGDDVLDECGHPCRVTWTSPIWLQDTYRVSFDDGSSVVVNGAHEWIVRDRMTRKTHRRVSDWRDHWDETVTIETREILGQGMKDQYGDDRWSVPCARSLECDGQVLPIDPYVLGVWLADGTSCRGEITLNETTKIAIPDAIRARGEVVTVHQIVGRYGIKGLAPRLRKLGVLNNKHVPMQYLRASHRDRLDLIRGIMDGDGFQTNGRGVGIDLCDEQLSDSILELILTFGWKPRRAVGPARITEKDGTRREVGQRWRIGWTPDVSVFGVRLGLQPIQVTGYQSRHTHRVIRSIEMIPSRPTVCIAVDSSRHLFLIGKNFIPTHNSFFAGFLTVREYERGRRVLLITQENDPQMTYDRLICLANGFDYQRWQAATLSPDYLDFVRGWREKMAASPAAPVVLQLPRTEATPQGIIRRAQLEGADSVVVDQISFIAAERMRSKSFERHNELETIMIDFADLIQHQYRVPLVLMNQINRAGVQSARSSGRYYASHLGGGSWVEQSSSQIWALYQSDLMRREQAAQLQCLKFRRGTEKHFEMIWRPAVGDIRIQREVTLEKPHD